MTSAKNQTSKEIEINGALAKNESVVIVRPGETGYFEIGAHVTFPLIPAQAPAPVRSPRRRASSGGQASYSLLTLVVSAFTIVVCAAQIAQVVGAL